MNEGPSKPPPSRFTKKRIAFVVGGILLAALACSLIASHDSTPMPEYQGKTARKWLHEGLEPNGQVLFDAFEKMGSNAVPFLVSELERKDSAWDKFYGYLYSKFPARVGKHFSPPQSQYERWAVASLILQTGDPRGEIPRLSRLLSSGTAEQRNLVLPVLCGIVGPNDTNCIPAFVNCLKSTNVVVCLEATDVLERLHSGKLAIAPLTNFLASGDSMDRLKCLDRLARIDVANSNQWRQLETNEVAWVRWQQKVQAGEASAYLRPGEK